MGMTRLTHRFAAWIACMAMLLGALAPALSQASARGVAAAPGDIWTQICSVNGSKFIKVTADRGDASAPEPSDSMHVEHCPLCATHGGALALPPSAGYAIALIDTQETHPFLFFQAPHPLAIWTAAQSRAPPAHA